MTRQTKLAALQDEAVKAWMQADGKGTIAASVAFGKTFTAFHCLYALLNEGKLERGAKVRVMAETEVREKTFLDEADKYEKLFGFNPYSDFRMSFSCYQGQSRDQVWDVLIADEIHMGTTAKYSYNFIDNKYDYIIGLTGTPAENIEIYPDDESSDLTKGDVLRAVAPIVYSYSTSQGIADGILSPFQTVIIEHELDDIHKTIKGGSKAKPFMQTERAAWGYAMSVRSNFRMPKWYKKQILGKATRMLWNLPSKIPVINYLLDTLPGQKLIFSNELHLLEQVTSNVVSGKVSAKRGKEIITDFNNGVISEIASAKKLKQGVTLEGLDQVIMASYYSKSHHAIQQIGRALRYGEGKLATIYILKTKGTYEERWLREATLVRDKNGNVVEQIDLNVVRTISSSSLLTKTSSL